MLNRCLFILLILSWSGCREGLLDFVQAKYPDVNRELWTHFETFETEGARRGIFIDLATSEITGSIEPLHQDGVAGSCSYGFSNPGSIKIDRTFWQRSSNLIREMIVFHELGHCYLKRGHLEDAFQSGYCISIMRSGTCCCRDAYTLENRDYYLDELFEFALPQ